MLLYLALLLALRAELAFQVALLVVLLFYLVAAVAHGLNLLDEVPGRRRDGGIVLNRGRAVGIRIRCRRGPDALADRHGVRALPARILVDGPVANGERRHEAVECGRLHGNVVVVALRGVESGGDDLGL